MYYNIVNTIFIEMIKVDFSTYKFKQLEIRNKNNLQKIYQFCDVNVLYFSYFRHPVRIK